MLTPMSSSRSVRAAGTALLLASAGIPACVGCEREVLARPGVSLIVTDADGTPLPGAEVRHTWWSEPHAVVEAEAAHPVDGEGRLELPATRQTVEVYPLCMHGVPEHHHTLCVGAPGHRPVALRVALGVEQVRGTVTLEPGAGDCGDDPEHLGAAPSAQSVEGIERAVEPRGAPP